MRLFWDYMKDRVKMLCCLILMESIAFFALWLQGTAFHKVTYALSLRAFVLALIGIWDFSRYCRKRLRLKTMKQGISYSVDDLPAADSSLERDYQELLELLYEAKMEADSEWAIARQDMLDYYSLWVHQIKTPIAALRLLLQAQRDGLLSEDGDTRMLNECNGRMAMKLFQIEQYVELVLSYLRIEDMGKDMVLREYPMDAIVNQAVKKFSREFMYRKIKLEKESINFRALTDEKWVLLVLEQILSNALKYTREGGMIRIYQVEGRNILVVEDNGIGIRREDLPRVFEKGFTGYNGREDKKSTGIGLYLCKSIMDKLNQGLAIESEPEKGTKVFLDFERERVKIE